jgi:hypothetical protein
MADVAGVRKPPARIGVSRGSGRSFASPVTLTLQAFKSDVQRRHRLQRLGQCAMIGAEPNVAALF